MGHNLVFRACIFKHHDETSVTSSLKLFTFSLKLVLEEVRGLLISLLKLWVL